MDEQELQEMIRKLQEAGDASEDFGDKVKDAGKAAYDFSKKSMADLTKSMGTFSASVVNGAKGFDQLNPVINSVGDALGGLLGAIPYVGGAAKGAVNLVTKASTFLVTQLERQRKTFNDVTASGLILDGNLSKFSQTAFDSLMNLETFGKIVADNGQALARMSGTAGQGAQKFGELTQSLTDDQTLRRLGYTAEEMGEITGGFIKQQTRLGMSQNMTTEQLNLQTQEYIGELDALSRLTGQNRKDLQAQQDALQREARFGTMMQRMESEGRGDLAKGMQDMVLGIAGFSPRMAEGLKDIMTSGTATTEEGRQLMMLSGGAIQGIIRDLKAGNIDYQTATQRLQKSLSGAESQFGSQAQILGDANPMLADFANIIAFTKASLGDLSEAQKQTADQQNSRDKLLSDMVSASTNLDKFSANLNSAILKFLPMTATLTNFITENLNTFAEKMRASIEEVFNWFNENLDPNASFMENTNKILDAILQEIRNYINKKIKDATGYDDGLDRTGDAAIGGGSGLILGKILGGVIGTFLAGPAGTLIGQQIGGYAGTAIGGYAGWRFNDMQEWAGNLFGKGGEGMPADTSTGEFPEERALGGPTRKGMPYLVGEKGPELFIPRTSGSVIPNFGGEGRIGLEDIAGPKRSMLSAIESRFDSIASTATTTPTSTNAQSNRMRDEELQLLASQSQKLDELIRLMGKQISATDMTRRALS